MGKTRRLALTVCLLVLGIAGVCCWAGIHVPWIDGTECGAWGYLPGDGNQDCRVDLLEWADLASNWLGCTDPNDPSCSPL